MSAVTHLSRHTLHVSPSLAKSVRAEVTHIRYA
jgi:hypothetical protein